MGMRKGPEDGLQARWREDGQVGEQRPSETIDRILDFILEAIGSHGKDLSQTQRQSDLLRSKVTLLARTEKSRAERLKAGVAAGEEGSMAWVQWWGEKPRFEVSFRGGVNHVC